MPAIASCCEAVVRGPVMSGGSYRRSGSISILHGSNTPTCSPLCARRPVNFTLGHRCVRANTFSENGSVPHGKDSEGKKRHAILHDFCMCIPYGGIVALAGVVGMFVGVGRSASLHVMGVGAAALLLSYLSLSRWQERESSAPFTAGSALLSGGLAYWMWIRVKLGEAVLFSSSVMWLSAAMCVFLVYNLIAGGNPPKKDKGDEMAVPSA